MTHLCTVLRSRISPLILILLGAVLAASAAPAGAAGVLSARRATGLAFLGGSVYMVKQGFDFRDEADEFYQRYERATDPQEIDRLYQRTNNRDIKSQLSWALGAAFAVGGLRLLLTSSPQDELRQQQPSAWGWRQPRLPVRVESVVRPDRVGLRLARRFF